MPAYHRTQRLQIFGEKPEIQKLYGSRYRMVVRCVAKNDTKAWYDDNKAQIFADFGSLYSAQMSVDGIDARTGEAYDDMVLVKNEATYTRSGEYVIIFTYETLTDSFVQETEDKVDFDLNGLKRLTRTIIAKDTVAYSSVVGTTTIVGSSPLLTLAQVSEDQLEASEDGFKRIQEVWLESGTLSETLDNVGSQKAKVIETIGADPATPSGYSLASKQESDFEGFQTNRFTFLKDNVELSRSEDKVGSQLAITTEVFKPESDPTESGYSVARTEVSDVDGIPTKRFTFLKDNVELSRSEDKVGSQLAITTEVFNPTSDPAEAGYSVARAEVSDVDGIPTKRFTFLKPSVLSRNVDTRNNGKLKVETVEAFNETPTSTIGGVQISIRESDVGGIPTNQYVFALGIGEVERSSQSKNQGALTITTVTSLGLAGTATGIEIEATTREEDGYILFRNTFADGNGEVSRTVETRNQGKLTITTVEALGTAGTGTGVEVEATTREQDGYTLFRNVFANGQGEVSRTTETRNQGKLTVTTIESLGSAGTGTGVEIEATTREQDGYTLFRNVFAQGQGEISRTVETRNQGKLTITTVESLGSAGTGTGVEIEATTREQDGYTLFRNTFAAGNGEVSRTTETRNKGALTVTTVEALGSAGTAVGVEIESTTREQDGYTLFRNTFADGSGEVSRTTETRNQGALTITTVEALGAAGTAVGFEIEATTREQDGYTLFRNTFAEGNGEVSRSTETRNQGKLTITTVEALGSAGSAGGVEIEATTREQDGYTLFRNVFADGQGEVSRSIETRNQGKLTVTTIESLGSAGTGTGVEIEATTREQDGYTLFRNTFAQGNGEVSRAVETRNQGKLTVTTVEALGSAGTGAGVEIEATTREQDGYTLFRNVFADGQGEVSRTTETRNQGTLTVTTVEALGAAGSAGGVEIESTTREQDGYTLFRNVFAEGNGEVSRTVETRNQGKLTVTTIESLGSAGTGTGVEIEATTREQDGYTLFRNVFANGQGEVSRTTETRNQGKLTITTIEALGAAGTGTGVEVESTTREQDGYTLFRNVFANGDGEVSRTTEYRNQNKLTVTTVEALGSAGTASGVEIEATTREQDGYTLFRNVFADGNGEVSRTTDKRNQGKLTITTVEALGSAGSATGVEIESTTREQDGYTLFRNVFAEGQGEVSRRTETRNQGKLTVTTVEALGAAGTGAGVEIEATTREENGYTLFRNVFADGQGEISRTTENRNQGKLTVTTVESLESAGTGNGVEIEATTREQDGYTLFRNTFAQGNGEVSRTVETKNQGKLTITTVESLGAAGSATGVEVESTTREQDGYTLFRNVFADGNGEISSNTEYRNQGKLTITTVESLGSAGTGTGVEIEATTREQNGYTLFRNVFADGQGEVSRSTEYRNQGKLTITTVEALGTAGIATGAEIESTTREQNGYTLFRNVFADGQGEVSVTRKPAPAQLAGCTYVTVRSLGTPVIPAGVLVAESETESDGYVTYEKTALQGTIIGVKQTYQDVVEVTEAGIVNCTQVSKSAGGVSGTIAVTQVTPPRTKTLAATVTVEVATSPPDTIQLAYDLGEISCSVTSISMSENFRGTDVFTTKSGDSRFSGQRKAADMSARISTYPNCYLSSSSGSGSFSYISSYQNDSTSPNNLVTSAQTSTTRTFTDGTGSTSAGYATTGVVSRKSRPILTALDGTIYFEVITWSV